MRRPINRLGNHTRRIATPRGGHIEAPGERPRFFTFPASVVLPPGSEGTRHARPQCLMAERRIAAEAGRATPDEMNPPHLCLEPNVKVPRLEWVTGLLARDWQRGAKGDDCRRISDSEMTATPPPRQIPPQRSQGPGVSDKSAPQQHPRAEP
jgi:hypothetical protein